MIIILTSVAIAVRIYYVNCLMSEVEISEEIYNAAKVTVNTEHFSAFFADGFNLKSLYIFTLYIIFLVYGNFTVAGVYLNLLYQVLAVLLVYISVRNVSNRFVGFGAGIVTAILPVYIDQMSKITVLNMDIFLVAAGCSLLTLAVRVIYNRIHKKALVGDSHETNAFPDDVMAMEADAKPEIQPVQDRSMKEIKLDDLVEKKVKLLDNPLPVPKRREHKEMDFALELTEDNDDYDLKDISGKDFFDIE